MLTYFNFQWTGYLYNEIYLLTNKYIFEFLHVKMVAAFMKIYTCSIYIFITVFLRSVSTRAMK